MKKIANIWLIIMCIAVANAFLILSIKFMVISSYIIGSLIAIRITIWAMGQKK